MGVWGENFWVLMVVLELITYVTFDVFLNFLILESLNDGLTVERVTEDDLRSSCSEAPSSVPGVEESRARFMVLMC